MRVSRLNNPNKLVLINVKPYIIDWENDGASKIEIQFKDLIKRYWINDIILYQFRIPASLLRIDFLNVNKKIAIEIDGAQHNKFNKHFHADSKINWLGSIKRDLAKEKWCEQNNIKIHHLIEEDLDNFNRKYILNKFGWEI